MLKCKARQYNYNKIATIEQSANNDHRDFWNTIKKLGPHKNVTLPLKVKIGDRESTELQEVKQKWHDDFNGLLNPKPGNENFDDEFLQSIVEEKLCLEHLNSENENEELNKEITTQELKNVIDNLKLKKACGIDSIPYEILKHKNMHRYLLHCFQACLKYGTIPSVWKQALIKPIPKSSCKDPLVPLNYRGISLISCISKVYSSVINARIVEFCDKK